MRFLRYGLVIAIIAVIALSVAGCSKEPLAAKVNGKKITIAEVDERVTQLVGQNQAMLEGEQGEQMKKQLRGEVLDQIIEMELLMQEVSKRGIKVTAKEIDAKIQEMMKDYGLQNEAEIEEALKQQNMTMAQFKDEVGKRIQIEKLGDQVTKDVKASKKDVKEYYEQNAANFATRDQVRAAHILVQEEDKAKTILADLKAGADFAKLAKEHSIDGSKDNGGEMPMTDKDEFVPEFAEACWQLEPGQISELVKTNYGYHIIKLLEKKAGAQKTFGEVEKEVEKQLVDNRKQDAFKKWLDGLKKKAKINKYLAESTTTSAPGVAPGSAPSGEQGAPGNPPQGAPSSPPAPQSGK